MPKKKVIHRSSETGKLVTGEFANSHPTTTEKEVIIVPEKKEISEITNSFGNGELNELKDKINEIIRFLK